MEIFDTQNLLLSGLSIFGIWVGVFVLYRDYRIDLFREKIFQLREELFDFADKGDINFEDQGYFLLRTSMNGFIRYAHKMTLLQILLFGVAGQKNHLTYITASYKSKWDKCCKGYDSNTEEKVNNFRERMNSLVVNYLLLGSPILCMTIVIPITIKFLFGRILKKLGRFMDEVDSVAFAYGGSS